MPKYANECGFRIGNSLPEFGLEFGRLDGLEGGAEDGVNIDTVELFEGEDGGVMKTSSWILLCCIDTVETSGSCLTAVGFEVMTAS